MESVFVNAARKMTGLSILQRIFGLSLTSQQLDDLVSWFCSSLRGGKNIINHYLDGISGCGNDMEKWVAKEFFGIMKSLLKQLQIATDPAKVISLLDALKWKYTARDHSFLKELRMFKAIHASGSKNLLRHAWGRKIKHEVNPYFDTPIPNAVLDHFEQVFLTVVGRIVQTDSGKELKI